MAGGEVYYGLSELVKTARPEAGLRQFLPMLGRQMGMVDQQGQNHLFRLPFEALGALPGRHAPHLDHPRPAFLGHEWTTAGGRRSSKGGGQPALDLVAVIFVNRLLRDLPDAVAQPLAEAGSPLRRV